MRVMQIVPELKSGGVERGTVDFARYLVEQGHHSVVISAGGQLVKDLVRDGSTHYRFSVHKKSLFSVIALSKTIAKIIRSEKIDIVHARSRVPAWIAFFACRIARVPLITTCHGIYSRHFFSRVMGWGKKVIVISHAVSRHMKENFGVSHKRIRLIHRGVNLSEFKDLRQSELNKQQREDKSKKVIGIVGRITPIKGHKILIQAMSRISRVFPESELWIVGQASKARYEDELRLLANKAGLKDKIQFMGTRYDVPDLLKQMDVLVAPAVGEEAFGRVMIEAGACGTPVVASRIGGIVDVITHGEDGLLTTPRDPGSVAEAVIGLLKEPDYAKRLVENFNKKIHDVFDDQEMFRKTIKVYEEALESPTILVSKFSALGDVILSVPTFRALRQHYPKARIVAFVERGGYSILRKCPYINDVYTFSGDQKWRVFYILRLAKLFHDERFDVCIDLQNNRFSHLMAYLSGAHTRIGYKTKKWDSFINQATPEAEEVLNPVEHQFEHLKYLGIEFHDTRLELWTNKEDEEKVSGLLKEQWVGKKQPLVAIHPGCSPAWKTKQWPKERFVSLCDRLSENNIRVVLTGSQDDSELTSEISKKSKSKPIDAAGKTSFTEFVELIRKCDAMVTHDSSPMHVAAAVNTPFVALFGPTDPERHAPKTKTPHNIIWTKPKCSPCYLKSCPVGLVCMKDIREAQVIDEVDCLLSAVRENHSDERAVINKSP